MLGALLYRAVRREPLAILLGSAYAVTDEVHQAFVTGRQGSPLDWLIDTAGVVAGVLLFARCGGVAAVKAVAVDLDALGDTRPLWRDFLADAARRYASISPLDPDALPEDRGAAAAELDRWAEAGVGDWRGALARFAEDRAPVYLRPSAEASAALRSLARARASGSASTPTRRRSSPASRSRISAPSGAWKRWRPARAPASGWSRGSAATSRSPPPLPNWLPSASMADRKHLDDRQLDAILERLDRLCDEVHALNRRLDTNEQLLRIVARARRA